MTFKLEKYNIYCMVDETVLCCECGNCPIDEEEDLYPFSNEEGYYNE